MTDEEKQARRWAVSKWRNENPSEQDVEDSYAGKFDNDLEYMRLLIMYRPKAEAHLRAKTVAFARNHREMGTAQARMSQPALVGDRS